MKTANTSRIVKKANKHLIFNTIKEFEPISIGDIVRRTRLSRPTVFSIIDELTDTKIISKTGFGESMGGRQPALYSLDLTSYYAMGIDFEFPPIRIVISNLKGDIVYSNKWEKEPRDFILDITDSILDEIEKGINKLQITKEQILGIGMGISGIVDINKNTPIDIVRIPEWHRTPINTIIQDRTRIPVLVRNDAHLVGMVESAISRMESNFIYIAYRTGIGAGVFMNGKLYDGDFGNPGYIGHTTVDYKGKECICGKRGCLELYCSKSAIEQKYFFQTGKQVKYDEILKRADEEEVEAIEMLEQAGLYFGIAVSNLIKIYDIANVIIGDIQCSEDNVFYRKIVQTAKDYTSNYVLKDLNIKIGLTDEFNFALGGCLFVFDKYFTAPKLQLKAN